VTYRLKKNLNRFEAKFEDKSENFKKISENKNNKVKFKLIRQQTNVKKRHPNLCAKTVTRFTKNYQLKDSDVSRKRKFFSAT
jgi:hypothetical protein